MGELTMTKQYLKKTDVLVWDEVEVLKSNTIKKNHNLYITLV